LPIHNFLCFICIYFFIGCSIIWFRLISIDFVCFFHMFLFVSWLCKLFMSCSYLVHGSSVHVLFMIYFCSCPAYMFLLISCSYEFCSCPAHVVCVHVQLVWILFMPNSCPAHASSAYVFLLMQIVFMSCSCEFRLYPAHVGSVHVLFVWLLLMCCSCEPFSNILKHHFLIHYLKILWFETSSKNEWVISDDGISNM